MENPWICTTPSTSDAGQLLALPKFHWTFLLLGSCWRWHSSKSSHSLRLGCLQGGKPDDAMGNGGQGPGIATSPHIFGSDHVLPGSKNFRDRGSPPRVLFLRCLLEAASAAPSSSTSRSVLKAMQSVGLSHSARVRTAQAKECTNRAQAELRWQDTP